MKVPTTILAAFALVVFLTTAALAQRTINDCEKIQAADAYNQCLAKFGPPAKVLNVESARPGDVKSGSAEAAAGAGAGGAVAPAPAGRGYGRRYGRGHFYSRRGRGSRVTHFARGGRKRMTITVGQ